MPERISTGRTSIQPRILRPVAAPGPSYVSPQANSDEVQLADALATLSPALARLGGVMAERAGQKARSDGEAKARELAEQGRTIAEMARTGELPPEQNPWFKVGFHETFGRSEGMKYVGDFLSALNTSGLDQTTDLAEYDAFERQFREQWLVSHFGDDIDPFTANAFGTTADGQMAGIRNEFARTVGQNMVKENTEAFHAELVGIIRQFEGSDFSPSELAAAMRLAQDRQAATGVMPYSTINRVTAEAIRNAAVRLRDPEVLDLLDQLPTDAKSKAYLGSTSYGMAIREEAENAIAQAVDADVRREEATARRTRTLGINRVSSALIESLVTDPGADITPFLREINGIDPTYASTLVEMRNTVAAGIYSDDPHMVQELMLGIHTVQPGISGYITRRDLDRAFTQKRLTLQTYRTLASEIEKRDEDGGSGKLVNSPLLNDIEGEVRRIFSSEYVEETQATRLNAQLAANEAKFQMLQWLQDNPGAAASDILAQQTAITSAVVRQRIGLRSTAEKAGKDLSDISTIKEGQFFLADPLQASRIDAEITEVLEGRRNAISPEFRNILRYNQVDPTDPDALRKFQAGQRQWTATRPRF